MPTMSHNPYAPPAAPVGDAPTRPEPIKGKILNPWFSMWTRPRATIAQIVERDPTHMVLVLAAIAGFGEALDRASMRSAGDTLGLPTIFVAAAIAGPVGGFVTLYLGSLLLRWTGSWIGGNASGVQIRAAMAWSGVPLIWALLLWVPELAIFGTELFTTATPRMDESIALALSFFAIELVIGVWAFVVFLKSLGQVQGFSAWKALANGVLALLVFVVPILLIVVAVVRPTS
jgi:hypothetical protein